MLSCNVLSSSYFVSKKDLKRVELNLRKIGFGKINFFNSSEKFFGKWAGSFEERLKFFYNSWNSNSSVVFCSKGGSGISHFINQIDSSKLIKKKLIVGYSDVTLLLNFVNQELGLISLHGPNGLKKLDLISLNSLKDALRMNSYGISFSREDVRNNFSIKKVEGNILGGNLLRFHEFVNLFPKTNFKKKIIFFEVNSCSEYKIFNLLRSMKCFRNFSPEAILFGNLGVKNKDLIKKMIKFLFPTIPLIFDLSFGHQMPNITIPIGAKCEIDFESNKIKFIFPRGAKKYSIINYL